MNRISLIRQAKPESILVHHRWIIPRDMPEVLAIERDSSPVPWTEEDFLKYLHQRSVICMVAEHGEIATGFMTYQLYEHHLDILRLAVHPAYRRRGIGSQMVSKLLAKLCSHRRTRLTVEVDDGNLGAHLFLRSHGFLATVCGVDSYRFEWTLEE